MRLEAKHQPAVLTVPPVSPVPTALTAAARRHVEEVEVIPLVVLLVEGVVSLMLCHRQIPRYHLLHDNMSAFWM